MSIILEIFKFVGVLSFLVIIHELGHFFVAKFFRVHVEEFGLGYPPRAKKLFTWGGTLFSFNWFPFGGFVKLEGEDGPQGEKVSAKKDTLGTQPFYAKPAYARLCIILAGATINFLFGIVAFSFYFSVMGIPVLLPNARIGAVAPQSPAAQAHMPTDVDIVGVKVKDKVIDIHTTESMVSLIQQHLGETVTVLTTGHCDGAQCQNGQQAFDVYLRKKEDTPAGQGAMGIEFVPVVTQQFFPWYEMPVRAAIFGIEQAITLTYFILLGVGQIFVQLFQGSVPQEVAGPVGIFTQASKAGFFSHGFLELVNFAGLLSVNLAIMNVLPIPALDGGRALFIVLEKIIGQKRVQQFEGYANYGGFALLLTLIVLVTARDIWGIFHH